MNLQSGREITGRTLYPLPFTPLVIERVNELGRAQKQPELLTFTDKRGRLIGDTITPGVPVEFPGVYEDEDPVPYEKFIVDTVDDTPAPVPIPTPAVETETNDEFDLDVPPPMPELEAESEEAQPKEGSPSTAIPIVETVYPEEDEEATIRTSPGADDQNGSDGATKSPVSKQKTRTSSNDPRSETLIAYTKT